MAEALTSPEFRASKKCRSFLTYVVEETLTGRQEFLKERVIGAEVFGCAPGFETAGDSIVRVKATELRRRLAKCFQGRREGALRIELPTGSYVPVFHMDPPASEEPLMAAEAASPITSRRTLMMAGGGLLFAAAGSAAWRLRPAASPLNRFWAPLVGAAHPIVICTSGAPAISAANPSVFSKLRERAAPGATIPLEDLTLKRLPHASWPTVLAIVDVSRYLTAAGKEFQVRVADELSFEQIRNQPIVVIGMFSNPWTIELTRLLRFTFESVPAQSGSPGYYLVRDAQRKEAIRRVDKVYPTAPMPVDYALVTRLLDSQQDRNIIAIGGISGLGTWVAADFATNPRSWERFGNLASAGWEQKNEQVLLETRIVGDTPSPPGIVAAHVW